MTTRRLPHNRPAPRIEPDRDEPTPNCAGNPYPFDELIDHGATRSTRLALRIARDLCGDCELRRPCLEANRDERWAQAILDAPPRFTLPPGSRTGAALVRHNQARALRMKENRLPALQRLVAVGATVDDACELFGIQRDTLLIWCKRNDQLDLYRALSGRRGRAA